jgi:hypothetical protein
MLISKLASNTIRASFLVALVGNWRRNRIETNKALIVILKFND